MNNPYKRIGGGSLDQALFKKVQQNPPIPSSTPHETNEAHVKKAAHESLPSSPSIPATQISKPKLQTKAKGASVKRSFIKRTFDIYEDQLSYLLRVSLEERLEGKEGSMNAMIREALDDLIEKRKANGL